MQLYQRVTYARRCKIEASISIGKSVLEISKELGLHRSSIYRELKRNSYRRSYDSGRAEEFARQRFKRCRRRRKVLSFGLKRLIAQGFKRDWSPEQISLRLNGIISHQTIYKETKNNLFWTRKLRRFGKRRGRGRRRGSRRKRPAWLLPIKDRPPEVNLRFEFGHWERDTMMGANRKSLLVCLERLSGYIIVTRADKPLEELNKRTTLLLKQSGALVRSMTNDNGNEFMDGYLFDVPVYYCDPHSPHQKGSVENVIGLLRQYVKRDTDLDRLAERDLKALAKRLNDRPRKRLDGMTPSEVFKRYVALAT